jgi:hypothetical protein
LAKYIFYPHSLAISSGDIPAAVARIEIKFGRAVRDTMARHALEADAMCATQAWEFERFLPHHPCDATTFLRIVPAICGDVFTARIE